MSAPLLVRVRVDGIGFVEVVDPDDRVESLARFVREHCERYWGLRFAGELSLELRGEALEGQIRAGDVIRMMDVVFGVDSQVLKRKMDCEMTVAQESKKSKIMHEDVQMSEDEIEEIPLPESEDEILEESEDEVEMVVLSENKTSDFHEFRDAVDKKSPHSLSKELFKNSSSLGKELRRSLISEDLDSSYTLSAIASDYSMHTKGSEPILMPNPSAPDQSQMFKIGNLSEDDSVSEEQSNTTSENVSSRKDDSQWKKISRKTNFTDGLSDEESDQGEHDEKDQSKVDTGKEIVSDKDSDLSDDDDDKSTENAFLALARDDSSSIRNISPVSAARTQKLGSNSSKTPFKR